MSSKGSSSRITGDHLCAERGPNPVLTADEVSPVLVGFTGTRSGLTGPQAGALDVWMKVRRVAELHHGDCVGADATAHLFALRHGWRVIVHPADVPHWLRAFVEDYDEIRPIKPALERNADIVAETTELVACPDGPEKTRSGTWATIRRARKLRRSVTIIWPDGRATWETPTPADAAPQARTETGASQSPGRNPNSTNQGQDHER